MGEIKKLPRYSLGKLQLHSITTKLEPHPDGAKLTIVCGVNDVAGGGPRLIHRERVYPDYMVLQDPAGLDFLVRQEILRAIAHEVDEWFCRDGVRLQNPHASDETPVHAPLPTPLRPPGLDLLRESKLPGAIEPVDATKRRHTPTEN